MSVGCGIVVTVGTGSVGEGSDAGAPVGKGWASPVTVGGTGVRGAAAGEGTVGGVAAGVPAGGVAGAGARRPAGRAAPGR